MGRKSGKAGSPVLPAAPDKVEDADIADPGKVAEIKAEQIKKNTGKYGAEPSKPHKPQENIQSDDDNKKNSWIEIELTNDRNEPVPGKRYSITLPGGETVAEGTLDENGWARVNGFEPGKCKITFPDLDKDAWEKIETKRPRGDEII